MPAEPNLQSGDATALREALAALDVEWSEPLGERLTGAAPRHLPRFAEAIADEALAMDLWHRWCPFDRDALARRGVLAAWRRALADALGMGLRLERVRAVAEAIAREGTESSAWRAAFEDAAAADDCARVRVWLGRAQYDALRAGGAEASWETALVATTEALFWDTGLVIAPPVLAVDDRLEAPWVRIEWNDLQLPAERGLLEHQVLVGDTVDRLRLLEIDGEPATHPATGFECAVVDRSLREAASAAGLTCHDWRGYLQLMLAATTRRAAAGLVNRPLWQLYRLRLRDFHPDLVVETDRHLDGDRVVQVLRALVDEGIGIRNLASILQALLEVRSTVTVDMQKLIVFAPASGGVFPVQRPLPAAALSVDDLVECARWRLSRQISHHYTRGQNTLIVYLVDPATEGKLLDPRPLAEGDARAMLRAVRAEVGSLPPTAQNPVVLTTSPVRRRLRRLLAPEHPHLAVLSYQELSPDLNIQPIARITPGPPA